MDDDDPATLEPALKALVGEDGPILVASWVVMVEYIDGNGDSRLGTYASHMPPWRLTGILMEGSSMLLGDYEDDD